jgi:hypothetical protein
MNSSLIACRLRTIFRMVQATFHVCCALRIVHRIENDNLIVAVLLIAHREDIYE